MGTYLSGSERGLCKSTIENMTRRHLPTLSFLPIFHVLMSHISHLFS